MEELKLEEFFSPEVLSAFLSGPELQVLNSSSCAVDTEHFKVVTDKEIQEAVEERVPGKTKKSTSWGYNI